VSFEAGAGGDHGALTGLGDDDHTQYIRVDGTRAFTGDQSMGSNRLTNLAAPTADTDAARLQDIGPGFYGLLIQETGAGTYSQKDDEINFDLAYFYVEDNNRGKPLVSLQGKPTFNDLTVTGDLVVGLDLSATTGLYGTVSVSSAIVFFPDTDTGLSQPAGADTLSVTAGNVEMLRFSESAPDNWAVFDSSRVGIGTGFATPQATLHVQGDGLFENGKVQAAGFYLTSGGELVTGLTITESEANGYSQLDDRINFDSDFFYVQSDGSGDPIVSLNDRLEEKSITVESPTATEDIIIWFTPSAINLVQIRAVVRGTTPSVTVDPKYGTDRSGAGTSILSSPTAVTNTTTGVNLPISSGSIGANNWIWLETTAQSGTVNEINLTFVFKRTL
jgi:hypothetical protein